MISTFIRNACGAVWNIVLLSTVDALDLLPSYEEVFELFSDIGLDQLGLLSVIMQHPLVRIAMGRLLEVLKSFASAKSELEASKVLLISQGCLLEEKDTQVEALETQNADLTADVAACKERIAVLEQQLRENAQAAVSRATQHNAALALARSKQAEAEGTARDMAAVAAAAEQKSASLEAAMQGQENIYEDEIACLATEIEQAQAAVGAAMEQATAEACTSKKLQEQLRVTEADRNSLIAALTAEQEARVVAGQRLASSQRVHGEHVSVLGLFAQQQTGAKEAMEAENRTLRSRLSCLEEQLRHASAGAERASSTSDCISTPTTPADPAAAASSGAGGASAGAPEHMASQAAEVEQEPLLGTLSAQEAQESVDYARKRGWGCGGYQKLCQHDLEEQLRHESAAASRAPASSKRSSTPTMPADPAAAASSGAGNTSEGAPEQMASQAVEVEQEPLLGSVSAREEQDFVDYARPRGWGRGGYQKLCQHDLS